MISQVSQCVRKPTVPDWNSITPTNCENSMQVFCRSVSVLLKCELMLESTWKRIAWHQISEFKEAKTFHSLSETKIEMNIFIGCVHIKICFMRTIIRKIQETKCHREYDVMNIVLLHWWWHSIATTLCICTIRWALTISLLFTQTKYQRGRCHIKHSFA